jgi:aspartate-semialdehyde dehydrogenase
MPSNPRPLKIAIVGATGAVGSVALKLLEARRHPAASVLALASARSDGRKLPYLDGEITVHETKPERFDGADVAFVSVSSTVSKQLQPEISKRGALMIDDGSAFRMRPDVPLVVPEVNGADVEWHSGIISIPNCTTTPLVMVLDALRRVSSLERVTIATYQAVSGTGAAAQVELREQSRDILAGKPAKTAVYPHQIAFNVLPQVDDFEPDGYTREEHKMVNETRKILHDPDLPVSATCVRVPVQVSHSEAVHIEFGRPVSPAEAREALRGYSGVRVVDDPASGVYPMPHQAAGLDEVFVGRVRKDLSHPNGLVLWLSCDNLRKGAALNALQILDEAVSRGCVKPVKTASLSR